MTSQNIAGAEGVKLLFRKTLDSKNKELRTALSGKPLVYLAGKEFAEDYITKRCAAKIALKSLRFSSEYAEPQKGAYKEVRKAPPEISIEDSVVIWDDYVALFNAKKLSGIIIEDAQNAKLMKSWFDFIWSKSS